MLCTYFYFGGCPVLVSHDFLFVVWVLYFCFILKCTYFVAFQIPVKLTVMWPHRMYAIWKSSLVLVQIFQQDGILIAQMECVNHSHTVVLGEMKTTLTARFCVHGSAPMLVSSWTNVVL